MIRIKESELINLIERTINETVSLLTENKEKCNGAYVGSNRKGSYYNDPPCEGGEECHRKYPFSNIWGCFDCSGGGRCGYDDYSYRPGGYGDNHLDMPRTKSPNDETKVVPKGGWDRLKKR